MPKVESSSPAPRRKSNRMKKPVKQYYDDEEDINSSGRRDDLDNSEDYTPGKTLKIRDRSPNDCLGRSVEKKPRRQSTLDEYKNCSVDVKTIKQESTPARGRPRSLQVPPNDDSINCVFCKEVLDVATNARFHYSCHYYDSGAFLSIMKPRDLKDGKAQDEIGKVIKYTCPHSGCTKRKMGYKEICIHLATAHQQLKELMMAEKRTDIKSSLYKLYSKEECGSPPTPVQVKQERMDKIVASSAHQSENSEDVDDPDVPDSPKLQESTNVTNSPQVVRKTEAIQIHNVYSMQTDVTPRRGRYIPRGDKLHCCLICKGAGPDNKEGRNLNLGSGVYETKYHYVMCAYAQGYLMKYVEHGQGKNVKFEELEEYGKSFKYKCPFPTCPKNIGGKQKGIGYKEYAIHCGVHHNQIEKWMLDDDRPGLRQVYDAVKAMRESQGIELEDMPALEVEACHTCLVCQGADKDGRNLGFEPNRVQSARYHYASCLYEQDVMPFAKIYPPGAHNTSGDGKPIDQLGREVKYSCHEKGCHKKRKMGYLEFAVHMANEHGGLDQIIKEDSRPEIRALADKLKFKK